MLGFMNLKPVSVCAHIFGVVFGKFNKILQI